MSAPQYPWISSTNLSSQEIEKLIHQQTMGSELEFEPNHHPFSDSVFNFQGEHDVNVTDLKFSGWEDPTLHLKAFRAKMLAHHNIPDELQCKLFVSTLSDKAITWFFDLPAQSVGCFADLVNKFLEDFSLNELPKVGKFWNQFQQGSHESLEDYIERFNGLAAQNKISIESENFMLFLLSGLSNGDFKESLKNNPPANIEDFRQRVNTYLHEKQLNEFYAEE